MVMASESGISPPDFWKLTYRELENHLMGYSNKRKDEWRRTRLTAYMTYCANAKNPVSINEFLPIDGVKTSSTRKRLMTKREYKVMQTNWN